MQNSMGGMKNMCKCPHHNVMPALVILFGLTFLLEAWHMVTPEFAMTAWPILVIVAGLMKWSEKSGMCKCC